MRLIKQKEKPAKRILIASGGNIGTRLAKLLENKHQVKVIELVQGRAEKASEELDHAIVIKGDAANEELLIEEEHRRDGRVLRPDQCR